MMKAVRTDIGKGGYGPADAIVGILTGGAMGSDPFDPASWSGISRALFQECRSRGRLQRAFGLRVPRWQFLALAAPRFHRDRAVWRRRVYASVAYRTALEADLRRRRDPHDVEHPIVQLGAYVNAARIYGPEARVFTFQDGNNVEFVNSGFAPAAIVEDTTLVRACFEFEQRVAQAATKVLTTSRYLRQSFIEHYRIKEENVESIGCGINLPMPDATVLVQKDYTRKELLFVGKEFHRKGGDIVCQAFRRARLRFPDAILHIVGSDRAAGAFARDPGVRVHGFLNRAIAAHGERFDGLLRCSTLSVLPSRYEPLGIAPLEAMAYGIPAIVTNRWALAENVTPGINGFHVEPQDSEGLADIIVQAWSDPVRLCAMGHAGRAMVEADFTWTKVVDRLMATVAG